MDIREKTVGNESQLSDDEDWARPPAELFASGISDAVDKQNTLLAKVNENNPLFGSLLKILTAHPQRQDVSENSESYAESDSNTDISKIEAEFSHQSSDICDNPLRERDLNTLTEQKPLDQTKGQSFKQNMRPTITELPIAKLQVEKQESALEGNLKDQMTLMSMLSRIEHQDSLKKSNQPATSIAEKGLTDEFAGFDRSLAETFRSQKPIALNQIFQEIDVNQRSADISLSGEPKSTEKKLECGTASEKIDRFTELLEFFEKHDENNKKEENQTTKSQTESLPNEALDKSAASVCCSEDNDLSHSTHAPNEKNCESVVTPKPIANKIQRIIFLVIITLFTMGILWHFIAHRRVNKNFGPAFHYPIHSYKKEL